jgi:hypothetical protein
MATSWGSQDAGLFLLALAEVPQVMSAFAPSPFTMRTFSDNPEKVAGLKRDLAAGAVVSVGIGGAIALITKRPAPLIGSIVVLALFLWWCHRALRHAEDNGGQDMTAGGTY